MKTIEEIAAYGMTSGTAISAMRLLTKTSEELNRVASTLDYKCNASADALRKIADDTLNFVIHLYDANVGKEHPCD